MKYKIATALALMSLSFTAHAGTLAFTNLTQDQVNKVIEEFSANFTHTSVSGASSLGKIFGLDLGIVGGITKTPEINSLATQADPALKVDKIPHVGILAMVSVPFGVTFEGNFVPSVGSQDFKFRNMGLGVKWSLTDSVLELPLSIALKAHYMKTHLEFKQTVSSVDSQVAFDNTVSGFTAYFSKKLVLIEPYIAIGMLSGKGAFDVTGTSSFFSFTTASTYSSTRSSSQIAVGLEANLLLIKLGAEYARQFGTNSVTVKAAFSF